MHIGSACNQSFNVLIECGLSVTPACQAIAMLMTAGVT